MILLPCLLVVLLALLGLASFLRMDQIHSCHVERTFGSSCSDDDCNVWRYRPPHRTHRSTSGLIVVLAPELAVDAVNQKSTKASDAYAELAACARPRGIPTICSPLGWRSSRFRFALAKG